MLTRKQKREQGLVGKRVLTNTRTGKKITIDFDETPVFTWEEREKYLVGQPGMKSFSEMTEEEQKVFTEFEGDEDELSD